jgi:hypothetical protein
LSKKPKRRSTPAEPGGSSEDSRSTSRRPAWLARCRISGLILLYVLLALNFIRLPKIAVNLTHDPGSHMSFEFYARAKYQFGLDVIQNVGPYGYLQYPYDYSGILPVQKLLFGILFGMMTAWLALDARRYFFSMTAKVAWFLALFMMLVPEHEDLDPVSYLFIFLAGHRLLLSGRNGAVKFAADGVLCAVLGLLCMMKSTNVMLVGLLMMLVVFERIRTRRFLELAWNLGCVGFTALLLWIHAGQKISNALVFMHGATEFSKGYNEALSFAGRPEMVWLGVGVISLFVMVNILRVLKFRTYWHRLPTSLFEAACIFIVWKHGYIRAGHELIFWAVAVTTAPLLFWAHERPPATGSRGGEKTGPRRPGLWQTNFSMYQLAAVPMVVTFLCAFAAAKVESDNKNFAGYQDPLTAMVTPVTFMASNFAILADWPAHLKGLKAELERNRADAALPLVKQAIGNATIDEFGYLPGVVLLNDFNYTPRPMPINFGATTKMLMERNADFYRNDATAPTYLLANLGQLDGRFAPQDDAVALPEVLEHYQPMLADHGFLLLKRTPGQPQLDRTFLGSQTIKWGESIPVPQTGTNLLWCSVDIKSSLAGRARSFLFQPAQCFIIMQPQVDRRMGPTRLLQSGASTGFLLRPLIQNGIDFLGAYGIRAQPVTALTPPFDHVGFAISPDDQAFFKPDITVSFWSVGPKK